MDNNGKLYTLYPNIHKFVFIEGNIASGKSTLLNYLSKFIFFNVIFEPIQLWQNVCGFNLLELLYKNTSNYAFPFQILVVFSTLIKILEKCNKARLFVTERSFVSSRQCFKKVNINDGEGFLSLPGLF